MRCTCCNRILNDTEATRRHSVTGEFLDICTRCIDGLGIPYTDKAGTGSEATLDDMEEEYVEDYEDNDLSEMQGEWS